MEEEEGGGEEEEEEEKEEEEEEEGNLRKKESHLSWKTRDPHLARRKAWEFWQTARSWRAQAKR